jgi:hypothetical protein
MAGKDQANAKDKKVTTKATIPDMAKIIAALKASGGAASGSTGTVYTQSEADKDVQTVFQQTLGRNAAGNDYAKALSIATGQPEGTGTYGRQQAVLNWIQNTPEFQARQDNRYLDAIYKEVASAAASTKVR